MSTSSNPGAAPVSVSESEAVSDAGSQPPRPTTSLLRRRLERRGTIRWAHVAIVLLSLGVTLFAWQYSKRQLQAKIQFKFSQDSQNAVELVVERMQHYEDGLLAATAFLELNDGQVPRQRWRRYVQDIEIADRHPGINGLGIIRSLRRSQKQAFEDQMSVQRPGFKIFPPSDQPILWPITDIIPEESNREAIGLDMGHEFNRRTAAEISRDTATSQVTGPITLVQDAQKTPGFLFFRPFYDADFEPQADGVTPQRRRERFGGLVYAPFVVRKLMRGTMQKENRDLTMQIRDGQSILYDEHHAAEADFDPEPLFERSIDVPLYGRTWTFDVRSDRSFQTMAASSQPQTILWLGLLIDSLLLAMFVSISRTARKALAVADQMTDDLRNLSLATEANQIGIWDYDPVTNQLKWDDTMFSIFGCRRSEFSSAYDAWLSRVHPEDREQADQQVQHCLASKESLDILFRIQHPDKGVRYIGGQGVVFCDAQGKVVRLLGANSDLTEQTQMIREMAQSRRLQAAIDRSTDLAVIATDLRGEIVHFNHGAEQMLGYRASELLNRHNMLRLHDSAEIQRRAAELSEETGRHVPGDFAVLAHDVSNGKASQTEFNYITKDGGRVPILLRMTGMRDQGGRLQGYLGVAADIRERREHLRAIEQVNRQLSRSNDELAQFAYVASHDLQAPLRRIISISDLLREELAGQLSGDAAEFMEQIESCADSMKGLISDLLAYCRVESADRKRIRCDVAALVDEAVANLSDVIADAGGRVVLGDLPPVHADPTQLLQVFQNLIGNAMKYRGEEPPVVRLSAWRQPSSWRMSVADNGIGIPVAHRQKVFGVFTRLHAEQSYPGNGIGLAICKRIVDRWGGQIWISDSPLQGVAFELQIPDNVPPNSLSIRPKH